jgi:hypothetical protein
MLNIVLLVSGLLLVLVTLYDVFLGVVVPRWTGHRLRLAPFISSRLWPYWKKFAWRLSDKKRSYFLASFAPSMLFGLLALWIALLILGFAMMLFALRAQIEGDYSFGDSVYLAGVAFLTIGFGDVVALGAASRFFTLFAGACGLSVPALVISLTFTLYGAFSRRESLVLTLDSRAGSPPSGVVLLETYARFELLDDLPNLFDKWELWGAELLESHLSYPLLPFFRSSHERASWVGSLGAVLDAATLLMTTACADEKCAKRPIGSAHLMHHMGCHILEDLSVNLFSKHTKSRGDADANPDPGISHEEFDQARQRLLQAGFTLREADESWRSFAQHRAVYAGQIEHLAQVYAMQPAQWISEDAAPSAANAR